MAYLVRESLGQLNDPVQILASIDPSGDGTAYLSTILPDGAQARWTCSSGRFTDSDSTVAWGRSVTWRATPGYIDSVTVVVTTPTATDSVRFLPVILEVTPTITVSSAYHLAILERTRSLSLPAGVYAITVEDDALTGYDGLTVLIGHFPGGVRDAWILFPGDSMSIDLPLGAEFEAVALDNLNSALDNSGSIFIRFLQEEDGSPAMETAPQADTASVSVPEPDPIPVIPDVYEVQEDSIPEDTVPEDTIPTTLPDSMEAI